MRTLLNVGIYASVFASAALSVMAQTPIPISQARTQPLGTVVTVAGRVSAQMYSGALTIQDGTGGIAIFDNAMKNAVQVGDSVQVTGPTLEFQPTTNQPGTGLLQISGAGTTYQIINAPRVAPTPLNVAVSAIGENIESVLVRIRNVSINETGAFQANTNYTGRNADGQTFQIRIDRNLLDIVGQAIPQGQFNLIGTVSQFRGTYQVLPRRAEEVGVEVIEDKWKTQASRNNLLEVATWNLEWFGDTTRGPVDNQRQFENVSRVIDSLNADIWGFQEIADSTTNSFRLLGESHPRYGFMQASDLQGQSQKTGFFFKRSVIDSLSIGYFIDQRQGSWGSGRYPFRFRGRVKTNNGNHIVDFFVIHARANGSIDSNAVIPDTNNRSRYIQRTEDAVSFRNWLNNNLADANIVVLGDLNDDVLRSTYRDTVSPYKVFVDDENWFIPTLQLSERGLGSYFFQGRGQMIDHILVNRNFLNKTVSRQDYTPTWGNSYVYNPYFLTSYTTTTSDHYTVHARFEMLQSTSVNEELTSSTRAYPTPASQTSTIEFEHKGGNARVEIYNAIGVQVATLVNEVLPSGVHMTAWSVQNVPSGKYFARISSGNATTVLPIVVAK